MKKIKKLFSMLLIICISSAFLVAPAHAEFCCSLSIDSIEQTDGKVIVNFTSNSTEDNRIVKIGVSLRFEKYDQSMSYRIIESESIVSSGEQSNSAEIDCSKLIPGEKYEIRVSYKENCSQNNCDYHYISKSFVCTSGMPVYEIGNTLSEEIAIGKTPIALKVTAPASGIYNLVVESENEWCLDFECMQKMGTFKKLAYIKENKSIYYTVNLSEYIDDLQSCTAKFRAELAEISNQNASTANPNDGDTVFQMTDVPSVAKLDIPQKGLYEIFTKSESKGNVVLLTSDGKEAISQYFNEAGKYLLNAGTYYYAAFPWSLPSDTYTTTIKYYNIETMQFGDEIVSNSDDAKYLNFKLDNAAAVWAEFEQENMRIRAVSGDNEWSLSDYAEILPAGEYTLIYSGNGNAVIRKNDIPIITIGDNITPYTYNDSNYVVLKAPETGEYEFYTDGCEIDEEWLSPGYYYMTMQAGETKFIYYYGESTVKAKKYAAEYTPININEKTEFNLAQGQRSGFSFTADAKDTYILSINDEYNSYANINYIKVYTDNKVLYSGENKKFKDLIVDLDNNETVYASISNKDYTRTYVINVTKPRISGDKVVDCSNSSSSNAREKFLYAPSEAGYYDFSISKSSGDDNAYIGVSINDESIGQISLWDKDDISKFVYVGPDEPLLIELEKGGNQTAEANLTLKKVESKQIENLSDFEISDNSYYSIILPESGVYKITGTAFYKASDWREEGTYGHMVIHSLRLLKIVKTHHSTMMRRIAMFRYISAEMQGI